MPILETLAMIGLGAFGVVKVVSEIGKDGGKSVVDNLEKKAKQRDSDIKYKIRNGKDLSDAEFAHYMRRDELDTALKSARKVSNSLNKKR